MCSIVGMMNHDGAPVNMALVRRMLAASRYRGPDDFRCWSAAAAAMGHARLSIIDVCGGAQPMCDASAAVCVVFNGEIYNYRELRAELRAAGAVFQTESDTEVLLALYRRYDTDMFARLNGMFALAIYDSRQRRLLLARDRFGKKPLYYYAADRHFVFASEIKSIITVPGVSRRIDAPAVRDLLEVNYVTGTRTLFSDIRALPAGSWLAVGERAGEPCNYWTLPVNGADRKQSFADSCAEFQELLSDAVRLRLRSDVPVGLFYSGGIDSSLIALTAGSQPERPTQAFIADFRERTFSEAAFARQALRRLAMPASVVDMRFDHNSVPALLSAVVRHAEAQTSDISLLPYYLLCRAAAGQVKVVLGGDGGDELFCGYRTYQATVLSAWVQKLLPRRLARMLALSLPVHSDRKLAVDFLLYRFLRGMSQPLPQRHSGWIGSFAPWEWRRLLSRDFLPDDQSTAAELAARYPLGPRRCWLRNLCAFDRAEYLRNDILVKIDRMSMAHGLEVRSPLLDHRIVEFAQHLPDRLRLSACGQTKVFLRAILKATPLAAAATRPKQGFSFPVHAWMRTHFAEYARDVLSPERVRRLGFLNSAAVQALQREHFTEQKQRGFELWSLLLLVRWHEQFVETPAVPETALVEQEGCLSA